MYASFKKHHILNVIFSIWSYFFEKISWRAVSLLFKRYISTAVTETGMGEVINKQLQRNLVHTNSERMDNKMR